MGSAVSDELIAELGIEELGLILGDAGVGEGMKTGDAAVVELSDDVFKEAVKMGLGTLKMNGKPREEHKAKIRQLDEAKAFARMSALSDDGPPKFPAL